MVTALAWAYVEYGETPAVEWLLYGVVPAVLAIIAHALFALLRTVLWKGRSRVATAGLSALAVVALAAYLAGVNELVVLFGGAAVAAVVVAARRVSGHGLLGIPLLLAGSPRFEDPTGAQLAQLFATTLKIGAVLYGSGYVLLAFLEGDFVDRLGWITHQLVDPLTVAVFLVTFVLLWRTRLNSAWYIGGVGVVAGIIR